MSRHISHLDDDNRRFDSALSLALDLHSSTRTSTSQQSWSSYNLRQDSLTDSVYETPVSSIHEEEDPVIVRAHPPIASSSVPRSASPLQLPPAPSTLASTTISCNECDTEFTGTYRKNNLARHVRYKHRGVDGGSHACHADGCVRVFKRRDARLKHERKAHPGLARIPKRARQETEHGSFVATFHRDRIPLKIEAHPDARYSLLRHPEAGSDLDEYIIFNSSEVSPFNHNTELPPAAMQTFSDLRANLSTGEYSHRCDALFTRWATIAQALKDHKSHAYSVFARVLADMQYVVEAIDCNIPRDAVEGDQKPSSHSCRPTRQVNTGPGTSVNQHSSQYFQEQNRSDCKTSTFDFDIIEKPKTRKLDCPLYKHYLMHPGSSIPPSCNGCSERYMSQIRNHIKRIHVRQQDGPIPFYHRCIVCNEDFIDSRSANDHSVASACAHTAEPKGDPVIPWARLYLTIYPNATQIPLPFTGELGWVAPAVVTRCQQAARSFLGEQPQGPIPPAQLWNDLAAPDDQPAYETLMEIMLQEASGLASPVAINSMQDLHNLNTPEIGRAAYLNQLDHARTQYLGLLINAPRYLLPHEISSATNVLVSIVDTVRAYQAASMVPAASTVDTFPSSEGFNNVFTDLNLSPRTDHTTAPDLHFSGPSGMNERHGSPMDGNQQGEFHLMQQGHDDLALFDLGSDIVCAEFAGSINFGDGA